MPPKVGRPFRVAMPTSTSQLAAGAGAVCLLLLLAATTRDVTTAATTLSGNKASPLPPPTTHRGQAASFTEDVAAATTKVVVVAGPDDGPDGHGVATNAAAASAAGGEEQTRYQQRVAAGCDASRWATGALVVGNRPVGTYLCDYFPGAPKAPGGCTLQCPASAAAPLGYSDGPAEGSTFPCTVLGKGSPEQLRTADVVVNHHGPIPKQHRPEQITLFYSGESNQSEGKKANASYQQKYSHVVSFHRWRPFHFTWTHRFQKDFAAIAAGQRSFPDPATAKVLDAIVVFVSRCGKGGRDGVIRALASAYTVHSFGGCVRTHRVAELHPECENKANRYKEKLCVFSKYRFALTLDNSREEDYVTEKVYHALVAGPVPIYDGAPNVDDFLPARNSIIRLGDFVKEGSKADFRKAPSALDTDRLVATLKRISAEGPLKAPELAWRGMKSSEWPAPFRENLEHPEPTCGVCAEAVFRKCRGGR